MREGSSKRISEHDGDSNKSKGKKLTDRLWGKLDTKKKAKREGERVEGNILSNSPKEPKRGVPRIEVTTTVEVRTEPRASGALNTVGETHGWEDDSRRFPNKMPRVAEESGRGRGLRSIRNAKATESRPDQVSTTHAMISSVQQGVTSVQEVTVINPLGPVKMKTKKLQKKRPPAPETKANVEKAKRYHSIIRLPRRARNEIKSDKRNA